jgi:hypothetical protein
MYYYYQDPNLFHVGVLAVDVSSKVLSLMKLGGQVKTSTSRQGNELILLISIRDIKKLNFCVDSAWGNGKPTR